MATAVSFNHNQECPICLENFTKPKILTCGHSFCLICLLRFINDRSRTFPCPVCGQDIVIPAGGAHMFITNFSLQPPTTDSFTEIDLCTVKFSTSVNPEHHCPNHTKREVDYYCQTCCLGLCSKCIYREHNDHKTIDIESNSAREMVVKDISKSKAFIKNKIKNLENFHTLLLTTSEKLKWFCYRECTKLAAKTKTLVKESTENCEMGQREIQRHYGQNELQLKKMRQKVMSQLRIIKTDLHTFLPSGDIRINFQTLPKLKDLIKLCDNTTLDPPNVSYIEYIDTNSVCDIWGSFETISLDLNRSCETNVGLFKFYYSDIKGVNVGWYSDDKYKSNKVIWSCCALRRYNRYLDIDVGLLPDDNQYIDNCEIIYTATVVNKDKDKNYASEIKRGRFTPGEYYWESGISIPWDKLTDRSKGYIDSEGQFLVRFDIQQDIDIKYK